MAAKDPAQRTRSAAVAGRARVAQADPAEITAARRAGAAAVNSPAALARRIVRKWPELSRAERAEVRAILASLIPRST